MNTENIAKNTSLTIAQNLIKSGQAFLEIENPVLAYIEPNSKRIRCYTFLSVNEQGEIVGSFNQPFEMVLSNMIKYKEYDNHFILSEKEYLELELESLKEVYQIGIPKQVNKARFWWMLEVLPPCRWTHLEDSELFYVSECITHDLYTFMIRIGNYYFEMVNHRNADINTMIEACKQIECKELPDEDEDN